MLFGRVGCVWRGWDVGGEPVMREERVRFPPRAVESAIGPPIA